MPELCMMTHLMSLMSKIGGNPRRITLSIPDAIDDDSSLMYVSRGSLTSHSPQMQGARQESPENASAAALLSLWGA
jgi:hypothetical protein